MVDPRWALAELSDTLKHLAAPASEQVAYLRKVGALPLVDELALEYDNVVRLVPELVQKGFISPRQAALMDAVSRKISEMSHRHEESLWLEDALHTREDWEEVRRLASNALSALTDAS